MSETTYLQNTHFYIPGEYIEPLVQIAQMDENTDATVGPNFSFDIIEQPFHCVVSSDDNGTELKLYIRSEVGVMKENPDFAATMFVEEQEDGGRSKITADSGRIGEVADTFLLFMGVVEGINRYVEENGLVSELSNIDTESEGFLASLNGEDLSFRKVSGKQRPLLACTTLLGGVQMRRPYMDEIVARSIGEMMPLEEKMELAENGDEDMMEILALAYSNGDDEVDPDPEKAVFWWEKLANLDQPIAQFNLGVHYFKGFGVPRDFEKAAYWVNKAAANGVIGAAELLKSCEKAVAAEKKADSGDAQAQADLAGVVMAHASLMEEQAGREDDYKLALELAEKSAAQNNGDGIWTLALAYEHGRGVEVDLEKTVELYRRGAELGHAPSQHSLACYYIRGDVVEENWELGFELSMKSAEQGYGLAMKTLGTCYQFGYGVEDDMTRAIEWYEKALEVIDDPELAQKVAIFKSLEEMDSDDDTDDMDENFDFDDDVDMDELLDSDN